MMKHRSKEEKFLLFVSGILLFFILAHSTCGRSDIVQNIRKEAIKQGVDPNIAVAVAKVESNFDQTKLGSKGEIGMFQIMPYHAKGEDLWNISLNIRIGVALLKNASYICQDMGQAWVVCYNNGIHRRPKYPQLHPYYKKVMEAMK